MPTTRRKPGAVSKLIVLTEAERLTLRRMTNLAIAFETAVVDATSDDDEKTRAACRENIARIEALHQKILGETR